MPRINLTKKAVEKLKAPTGTGKPVLYWDDGPKAVRGFGVLCSGKTTARSYIAQRDLPGGKARRVTIASVTELTVDEARKRAADVVVDMRRGLDPKAKRETLTLRSVLDSYTAKKKEANRLRERSEENYRDSMCHLEDWLDRPLTEITRDMVEGRHKNIAKEVEAAAVARNALAAASYEAKAAKAKKWPEAQARYLSAAAAARARKPNKGHATANGAMRSLRALWNFALDKNPTLGPNPVRLRGEWYKVPRRTRMVRADAMAKFYAALMALENHVQRDYLKLILFTGMRRGEAESLRWEDIDLRARTIHIPAPATKADRKLDLPMSDVIHAMLVARRSLGDAKWVFPANSESGHIKEPKFACGQIAKASGVRISPHDLRRTFTTIAESLDISEITLKCLINHARPVDTTGGYVIVTAERLRGPTQRVADELKALCGITEPTGDNLAKLG